MIEQVKEYREIELDIDTDANTSVTFFTEMPNAAMTAVAAATVVAATTGRQPVNFRLPGSAKGKLCKLRITSTAAVRLFGAKVFCRYLGSNSAWKWAELPVEPTALLFDMRALPIEQTPELFSKIALPIESTPEVFSEKPLLIEPTSEVFAAMRLPFEQTPVNRVWVDIPVDEVA